MTMVVLCKKGKANYSFLRNYHLIILKNTFNKILKKVIIDYMVDIAEKHALLPQSQIGARKNRSTLSVFTLLTNTIKTAWAIQKDFVISMLSLDISGAYDNVPYERLLYIFKTKGFLKWII